MKVCLAKHLIQTFVALIISLPLGAQTIPVEASLLIRNTASNGGSKAEEPSTDVKKTEEEISNFGSNSRYKVKPKPAKPGPLKESNKSAQSKESKSVRRRPAHEAGEGGDAEDDDEADSASEASKKSQGVRNGNGDAKSQSSAVSAQAGSGALSASGAAAGSGVVSGSGELPGFGQRVRDTFLGGNEDVVNSYRQALSPQDYRRNLLELKIAPVWVTNQATSISWFRSYSTSTPGAELGATVWFTPFLGFDVNYLSTFAGSFSNSPSGGSETAFTDRLIEGGLRFRRFANIQAKSSGFIFGLDYRYYEKRLSASETMRAGLSSRGIRLAIENLQPVSKTYSWRFGAEMVPQPSVSEDKTALDLKSGNLGETFGVGAFVGGEFFLDRENRIFWRIRDYYERVNYTGNSSPNDPVQNAALSGVSVSNNLVIFEIGATWGR